jgi:phosphatidate cytidylyltransferase
MTAPEIDQATPSASQRKRGDLVPRLLTAAVGIPLVLGVIWMGGIVYVGVVAVLLGLAADEVYRAAGLSRFSQEVAAGSSAAFALAMLAAYENGEARLAIVALLVVWALVVLVLKGATEDGFRTWSIVVAGALYAGLLGSYLVSLRLLDDGRYWVLLAIFTTFAADTGAYAIGRLLGRRKLAPRISPGKTLEGGIGGLVAAASVCLALNQVLGLDQTLLLMLALGAGIGVAGQLGDLSESLLKRSLGVKDMGRLFPGHGGVLDRLDSILFVAPLVYYVVRYVI